jgi:hypothetical protein
MSIGASSKGTGPKSIASPSLPLDKAPFPLQINLLQNPQLQINTQLFFLEHIGYITSPYNLWHIDLILVAELTPSNSLHTVHILKQEACKP